LLDAALSNRSYFDFYFGFGYSLAVAQAMSAVLL
jgi:hypothetical protein